MGNIEYEEVREVIRKRDVMRATFIRLPGETSIYALPGKVIPDGCLEIGWNDWERRCFTYVFGRATRWALEEARRKRQRDHEW